MKYRYLIGDFWSLGHEIITYLHGFWSLGHEISDLFHDRWSLGHEFMTSPGHEKS